LRVKKGMLVKFSDKDDYWIPSLRNKMGVVLENREISSPYGFYVQVNGFKTPVVIYDTDIKKGYVIILGSMWRQKIDE